MYIEEVIVMLVHQDTSQTQEHLLEILEALVQELLGMMETTIQQDNIGLQEVTTEHIQETEEHLQEVVREQEVQETTVTLNQEEVHLVVIPTQTLEVLREVIHRVEVHQEIIHLKEVQDRLQVEIQVVTLQIEVIVIQPEAIRQAEVHREVIQAEVVEDLLQEVQEADDNNTCF